MFKEKILYILQLCIFNVAKLFTNCHPFIGMLFVRKFAKLMPYVAIRLINIMLLKFFTYYFSLHFQGVFIKSKREHPVAFQPKSGFDILSRQLAKIIGEIIGGVGIVFAPGHLQWLIIRLYVQAASKHKVFK